MNGVDSARTLGGFYDFLCQLDFYKDLQDTHLMDNGLESDANYKKMAQAETEPGSETLVKVPLQFIDDNEYIRIWTALFQLESKAQVVKSIQQEAEEAD